MARIGIPDGYELLAGRSRDNAREAIARADGRGLPPEAVLTRRDGYLIPLGADEIVADSEDGDPVEVTGEAIELPDESWKNEDIDAWAAENLPHVSTADLKKAEKIQAIQDAIPELSAKED